jgi:predicted RNase H-like HicB family nuclease
MGDHETGGMEAMMNFPVVIHKDPKSDYGVIVPDLPGCFSAGRTIDEALAMAREAIELHLDGMIDDGEAVPKPGAIEDYRGQPGFRGGVWAVVSISPAGLRVKARRINISLPERVLEIVDGAAKAENETRSGLLVKAVRAYVRQTPKRGAKGRLPRAR